MRNYLSVGEDVENKGKGMKKKMWVAKPRATIPLGQH